MDWLVGSLWFQMLSKTCYLLAGFFFFKGAGLDHIKLSGHVESESPLTDFTRNASSFISSDLTLFIFKSLSLFKVPFMKSLKTGQHNRLLPL